MALTLSPRFVGMLGLIIACVSLAGTAAEPTTAAASPEEASRLWDAARNGSPPTIEELVRAGTDINTPDEKGRTALHYAAENGHMQTVETILKAGGDAKRKDREGLTPLDLAKTNRHGKTAAILAAAMRNVPVEPENKQKLKPAKQQVPPEPNPLERDGKQTLNPSAKYHDQASFEKAIKKPAVLLKSEHVWFFAAKEYEAQAKIIFPYLVKAYDELKRITSVDTKYIILVYNFPKNHPDVTGGTSECALWYDDGNLKLDEQEEWKQHRRPHVSGYIEEMAHNFVSSTKAQFGWEMMGWSIGAKACSRVAANPIHSRAVEQTRRGQLDTFQRYKAQEFTFPGDLPANQVDRIHAHLLGQCDQRYRGNFWADAFKEIGQRKKELVDAVRLGGDDAIRNERYRITVECFDKLPGLNFKQMLEKSGISTTVDVKSLHPTEPGWNRKLK